MKKTKAGQYSVVEQDWEGDIEMGESDAVGDVEGAEEQAEGERGEQHTSPVQPAPAPDPPHQSRPPRTPSSSRAAPSSRREQPVEDLSWLNQPKKRTAAEMDDEDENNEDADADPDFDEEEEEEEEYDGGSSRRGRTAKGGTSRPTKRSKAGEGTSKSAPVGAIICDVRLPNGQICGTHFRRPYDLDRHKATLHAAEKPEWICEVCGGKFSRKDAKIRHQRRHK
ncbi:hypothetical protein BT69DRAFT_1278185 [Atractiella rhizophila]|nr:hypothetical protein BT69DRAFT_1283224 [Atractiella rhizophila]KAH8927279.1 hypothetical protein BT69DRAFT_1278185 [Atractiella rhizophila]